jgi:hypothetical protein
MKINNGLKMIFSLYALCVFVACNVNVQKDDNKSTIKLESEMLNVELNETIAIDSLEIDAKRMVVYIANKIPRPVVYGPNTFSILELLIRISKQKGTNTAMLMIKDAFIMIELI